MKVSKRGEYGMRALCHLAGRYGSGLTQIKQIAEAEAIPGKFLESILLELKRAGFLESRRGSDGGYGLARIPSEIFVGEAMRVLDGSLAPMASASELRRLVRESPGQAGFYSMLMDVRNAVSAILDRTSLQDLLERNRSLRQTSPGVTPAIQEES